MGPPRRHFDHPGLPGHGGSVPVTKAAMYGCLRQPSMSRRRDGLKSMSLLTMSIASGGAPFISTVMSFCCSFGKLLSIVAANDELIDSMSSALGVPVISMIFSSCHAAPRPGSWVGGERLGRSEG